MKFKFKPRENNLESKYPKLDRDIARKFAKTVSAELGDLISALVLFGSAARGSSKKSSDIDILLVVDDVHINMTRELVETYRILVQKSVAKVNPDRLHVQTLPLTTFWEYVRAGDPVAVNILRDGIALIDKGFFDPLQILLLNGRIRPSGESVHNYLNMAYSSLNRAKSGMDNAIVDLYWATIDAAHAALMSVGEVPTSPSAVADMIDEKLVKQRYVSKKYSDIMRHMYEISKRIMKREVSNLDGKTYDRYLKHAEDFVEAMKKVVNRK
ncbi:MAG: nucleotidyltransferase domain-containing protein [Candidatus Nanoarchaeia archaeon]|nr:nucleotidyltransferase domain-containing protein [Candidatus Nanoarchaeia archaeon]|tara:strand:- start:574 stop:1380 length:807 start_codon:yes stop_codon:yes gene_type:complete